MQNDYIKQRLKELKDLPHYKLFKINQDKNREVKHGQIDKVNQLTNEKALLIKEIISDDRYKVEAYNDPLHPALVCISVMMNSVIVSRVHMPQHILDRHDIKIDKIKLQNKWSKG